MVTVKRKFPLRRLLVLCYLLTFVLLMALLVQENQRDELFSLSHVSSEKKEASTEKENEFTALSIYGDDFHSGIRGVLTQNLVNENALLWHHLVGVPVSAIDVKEGLALVSCYKNKLVSIDLQQGTGPKFLGSIELPNTIRQIKIVGDQVLVGMRRHAGLALIDMKDPKALKLVAHFPATGSISSITADRSSVYFTDVYEGLFRINLSAKNPVPEKVVSLKSSWQVALQGKMLAVGTLKGHVYLFDISQDGPLVAVGSLDYPVNVRGIAFTEGALAVALSDGTLNVFNLSSWPKLHNPAQLMLPGRPWQLEPIPGQSRIAASLAAGGLSLIDVSQPGKPIFTGHLKSPRTFLAMAPQFEKIYGASHYGLEAFSLDGIEEGGLLRRAEDATIEPTYYKLQKWNGHVYGYNNMTLVDFGKELSTDFDSENRFMAVADRRGGSLFEQREDGYMQGVGSLLFAEGARELIFRDSYLYVINQDGLQIFSGIQSGEPAKAGELQLPGGPTHFEVLTPGYLLITTSKYGFFIVDVNDPQQPIQVASRGATQHLLDTNVAQDVLVDGPHVYISQGAGGVCIFDISVPSQPELLQIIDTPGKARGMALYDSLLLVADGSEGVFMIDVKDRNDALSIGSLPTPLRVVQIAVTEKDLIVSSKPGGTMKLPLPQRLKSLHVISEGEMRVGVEGFEKGQYVHLYDERTSGQVKVGVQ
jgi:hypothetical protein